MPQKTSSYQPTPTNPNVPAADQPGERNVVDDSDAFLDEVDAVLEENELEVVRAFVQRGGQ